MRHLVVKVFSPMNKIYIFTLLLLATQYNGLAQSEFSGSNLPILEIDADQSIPDDPKVTADFRVYYHVDGARNSMLDQPVFEGLIGIELRGNSTQTFPKKPYNFEIRDAEGEDLAIELLGMPEEADWVLRASYLDHTFIRNPLAMHMSRQMGRWASRCRLVEVVLNGQYQGIYILMEKIKRDKNRVDINKLKEDEISGDDLTGGYIYEVTGQGGNFGKSRLLKYPKIEDVQPEQLNYIEAYDDNFRAIMQSEEYTDSISGYHSVIDVASFIDELLLQEAIRNSDAYGWSAYFHKEKEEKLKAGPVWDFDQSSGNSSYPDDGVVEGWMFEHPKTNNTPFFWKKLFEDPYFAYAVRQRWETLRETVFQTDELMEYIDSVAGMISVEAEAREFERWPVLGVNFWRETNGFESRDTYQKEVDYLKSFLVARWDWMDQQLMSIDNPNPITSNKNIAGENLKLTISPNPVQNNLHLELNRANSGEAFVEVFDSEAHRVYYEKVLIRQGKNSLRIPVHSLPVGMYFVTIVDTERMIGYGKFSKSF